MSEVAKLDLSHFILDRGFFIYHIGTVYLTDSSIRVLTPISLFHDFWTVKRTPQKILFEISYKDIIKLHSRKPFFTNACPIIITIKPKIWQKLKLKTSALNRRLVFLCSPDKVKISVSANAEKLESFVKKANGMITKKTKS